MKFYLHTDGVHRLYPERIPPGMELVITPDFRSFWRKIA